MVKPFAIAFAYLSLVFMVGLPVLRSGWIIPAAIAPPAGWPFNPEARAAYKPNWSEAKEYFTP